MHQDHIAPELLTARNIALLDQNWERGKDELQQLLMLNREHRGEGCTAWYCCDEEMAQRLNGLDLSSLQMVLRVALERLT